MKVSELTIPQLNHWVAKSLGWEQRLWGAIPVWFDPANEGRYRCHVSQWNPTENWSQGGPIIEREHIQLKGSHNQWRVPTWKWMAWPDSLGMEPGPKTHGRGGETSLIAAMRCFVASKFGEEVDEKA